MAKDDFHIVAYRILAYLYNCLKHGETPDEAPVGPKLLGITAQYWTDVLRMLSDEGFITGARFNVANTLIPGTFGYLRITRTGIEFMNDNKSMRRALKWLKDLKDTIPGI